LQPLGGLAGYSSWESLPSRRVSWVPSLIHDIFLESAENHLLFFTLYQSPKFISD
jgi:hypothetical protein